MIKHICDKAACGREAVARIGHDTEVRSYNHTEYKLQAYGANLGTQTVWSDCCLDHLRAEIDTRLNDRLDFKVECV